MGLDEISQNSELRYCDRCGFKFHLYELFEDPQSPGIYVCKKNNCLDRLGFNEVKTETPKNSYNNYFKT